MDKRLLNEIHRNKELMGLNEQGVVDAVKRGVEKGKKMFNRNNDELENTDEPINVEKNGNTTVKFYNEYITIESTTPSSNREIARNIITQESEKRGLTRLENKEDEVYELEDGGYKIIRYFNKNGN